MERAFRIAGLTTLALQFTLASAQSLDGGGDAGIETIVVTATRLEQTAAEAGATVRVIDAARLEDLGFNHAVDAISTTPGVTINQNGAFGGSASVRIRGASSDQTLVLIDGVAVNDPSSPGGGFNFARLDTEHIERIEILSGPQSTLWGTDAIGGVVSIVTKRPGKGLNGSLFGQAGSFDTFRGGASVSHGGDAGDFRLAATQLTTRGISKADERNGNTENDGFDSLTMSAKAGLNLPRAARLDTSLLWNDAQAEFDSFRSGAEGSVGDGDEVSETMERSAHVALTAPLFDGRLDNRLLVGRAEIERHNLTNGFTSFDAMGERTLFRYQGTLEIDPRNTLAAGAEREKSTANAHRSVLTGLFALYEFRPGDRLTLTGGVRSDDHDRFGSETTARLAASYRPSPRVTLRGSWGQGFKAPTIFQSTFFCCGATAANESLRPEHSNGMEAGLDWKSAAGRVEAGITLFRQDTEDMINFSFSVGGYENIARVESQGIEVSASWTFNEYFEVRADYAWIDAAEGNGNPLLRLPRHSATLLMGFDPPGAFSGTLLLRYNGLEPDRGGVELDAWTRLDFNARYELSDRFEVYGRIENLFDTHYQQILGYGTPGRSVSVGARWQY
ncbi:MAG: TonB-dependent receptor [Gammaproteobacteria bacterium]|nr:TonB-dependent receptor [Gammaproteobacteria bacterium]MYD00967.1 TonB-dependent receptor [Gammaproteobacteria bacterium]MYI24523.1 TonB-dependent receptor [Gammaproteobacteria bacterium]